MNTYQADMSAFGIDVFDESNVKVITGYFGALTIFAGAVLRPVGGVKALYFFYGSVALFVTVTALVPLPFFVAIAVLFIIMASLGMANGAVFQLVPQIKYTNCIGSREMDFLV